MNTHCQCSPTNKKLFTPGVFVLLSLMGIGLAFAIWRFLFGMGAVTNLSDSYPWGIWIAIDVESGVALAAEVHHRRAGTHFPPQTL